MTDGVSTTTTARNRDIEAIREALRIGAISYDGDPWYAASDEGGAGLGYDECEAAIKEGFAAIDRVAALLDDFAPHLDAALDRERRNTVERIRERLAREVGVEAFRPPAALDVIRILDELAATSTEPERNPNDFARHPFRSPEPTEPSE